MSSRLKIRSGLIVITALVLIFGIMAVPRLFSHSGRTSLARRFSNPVSQNHTSPSQVPSQPQSPTKESLKEVSSNEPVFCSTASAQITPKEIQTKDSGQIPIPPIVGSSIAYADSGLLIETSDPQSTKIEAPLVLTRAFVVTNATSQTREILEEVVLPEGWQRLADDTLFSLSPGGRELRLFGISIPAQATPGTYTLVYNIKDRWDSSFQCRQEISIDVIPIFKCDIVPNETAMYVIAGDDYRVNFRLVHRSNTTSKITLRAESSSGYPVRLNITELSAEPGSKHLITAVVTTDRNLHRTMTHRVALKANMESSTGARTSAQARTSVEIIPRTLQSTDYYHRVPSKLVGRFVGDGDEIGFQIGCYGTGNLDDGGRYRVDYLLQGPRDFERNIYGVRDEYYVRIRGAEGELRVGDQAFSFTPLMERNRLGRGANVSLNHGRLGGGIYSFRAREKYPDLEETAIYAGARLASSMSVRLNFMNKKTQDYQRNIFGLSSSIAPTRNLQTELEYAIGEGAEYEEKKVSAFRGLASGKIGGARFTLEKIYADPDFPGYYRDRDHNIAYASVPIVRQLRVNASYQYLLQNIENDTTESSATREQYLQSGFIAQLPFRTTAEVYFEDILRRDQLFPIDFDTRARSMNLRMSYALRILSFNVSAKRGTWDDFLVGEKEHLERYRIGFSFSPDSRQSYTGSYQTGHSGFSIGAKQSRTASFTARCNLIRRLSLLATVQKSNWGDQSNFENDQVRLDVRYLLPNDHGLSFRFRNLNYRREGLADGLSYILSYDIPLGVPVGKQRRLGSVKGKICDAEDPEQKGVSGVLLTLGDMTTVTDNKGNYTFSSVKRGAHYLQLDNASIGLDRTTAQKLPMQVYVRGGRSEKLDLNVIRSASIRGEVALFGLGEEESRHGIFVEQRADSTSETKEDSTLHRLQGVSDIQLELRSEQETLVEITDRLGRFSFHNLRPGKWVLHVSSQGLPAYHDLEQDSYELDIEPGGTEEIAIRVIPRIRHIIIQEEGKIPVISGRSK